MENQEREETKEKRREDRFLAICEVFDQEKNLTGMVLDLSEHGIHIIVPKNFTQEQEFSVILRRLAKKNQPITVKVAKKWRKKKNEQFDEIGGELIEIDNQQYFVDYLNYFQEHAKKYYFDL